MKGKFLYYIRLGLAVVILCLFILAVFGVFYPIKIFDIQFSAILQRLIIDFSLSGLILFSLVIVITLIFGRLYCSTYCPVGIMQELFGLLFKNNNKRKNTLTKYIIMIVVFGLLVGGSASILKYIEPYTIFTSALNCSVVRIVILSLILALTFYRSRYFCTNICPVGALLGLISKVSLYKIVIDKNKCVSCGKCEKICQAGCIDSKNKTIDNENCLKCLKCLGVCSQNAISYSKKSDFEFNPKRRDFIIGASLLVLFGGAVKTGIELVNNISKKICDIILPPGAKDKTRMLSKCFDCDLCIKNCPNKILSKSKEFNVVKIDYSKGYCEYNCNNCSKVCPTGAIEKISLKEKQNTVIGIAVISDDCQKCMACIQACPKGAISVQNNKVKVDSAKCIGCGKCNYVCGYNAIKIYPANKQSML